jgi:pimeloyl-ACP methyl ester carboxylesterase
MRKLFLSVASAVLFVFVALVRAQDVRVVSVDGRGMRVSTAGLRPGSAPTVVFESGLGGRLEEWNVVAGKVAAFAPTVAYERAGVGQSDPDGEPPTPRHVARKLHGLLTRMEIKPPYVLVGHSWGGPLIRMFAAVYPGDVAGLVYVDPTDMRSEEEQLAFYKARGHAAADVPALRAKKREQVRAYGAEMKVALDLEDTYFAEFRALPAPPDVPVSVLMATKFDPAPWAGEPCQPRACHDAWVRLRIGWLAPLAHQSSDGTFTLTTSSGHRVTQDDPDLIVWAIQRVLKSAAARRAR